MKRSKGFTLIELLAVIVILAIIALIATPMVLKYIDKAKEGSNDISAESILKAADNYYLASQLNGGIIESEVFDLTNNDDVKKLGLKGNLPQGILRINSDGTTYLQAYYEDGSEYTKLENETKVTKNDMVIGDSTIWITDNKGTITGYVNDIVAATNFQVRMFSNYLYVGLLYVNGTTDEHFTFQENLTLQENVEEFEKQGLMDRSGLLEAANVEIDSYLILCNQQKNKGKDVLLDEVNKRADEFTYMLDFSSKTLMGTQLQYRLDTLIYNDTLKKFDNDKTIIIPNYIRHEDGTLEKIITIGNGIGSMILPENKNFVISHGVEVINDVIFYNGKIASVVFPNTIKIIGDSAFKNNNLTTVTIPGSIISIGKYAFEGNKLKEGSVIIRRASGSDLTIGNDAFGSVTPIYQS